MTQLEAINEMLVNAGEYPVDAIDTGNSSVAVALQTLNMTDKEVQSEGWNANTDYGWEFVPDINGNIAAPANTLSIDPQDPTLKIIVKDYKLYDKERMSYIFDKKIIADVTWHVTFEDLPFYLANYITIRAARKYANRAVTSDTINGLTKNDEYEARAILMQRDLENADHSIFDSYSVYQILERTNRI